MSLLIFNLLLKKNKIKNLNFSLFSKSSHQTSNGNFGHKNKKIDLSFNWSFNPVKFTSACLVLMRVFTCSFLSFGSVTCVNLHLSVDCRLIWITVEEEAC